MVGHANRFEGKIVKNEKLFIILYIFLVKVNTNEGEYRPTPSLLFTVSPKCLKLYYSLDIPYKSAIKKDNPDFGYPILLKICQLDGLKN